MLGFRRVLAALAVSSAIAGLGAAPALASNNPHDRQLQQLPPPFTQAMCGPAIGDVTLSIDPNTFRAATKTFTLQDGTTKIELNGYARQIVQGNGKTLELNVSGPGTIFIAPDGAFITAIGGGHPFSIRPAAPPPKRIVHLEGPNEAAAVYHAAYRTTLVHASLARAN